MGTGSSVAKQHWVSASTEDTGGESQDVPPTVQSDLLPSNHNVKGISKLMEAKKKFMKNRERTPACFNKQLDRTDIIKELYKRMDHTVTQPDSGDIKGDIQLSLKYNYKQQLLLVKVIRARDLVPRDLNGRSDPYVVLELIPDRKSEGKKKTGFKAKTLNPVFSEIFSFHLDQADVTATKLRVAVWDHDFFGEDDFNGEAIVDLSMIDLNTGTHTEWFMLQLETDLSISGDLEVSFEYQEPETLLVTVHRAQNLKAANTLKNGSDAYVRCAVSGLNYHEQTKVIPDTVNPEFEETFEFTVPAEECASRAVLFHVFSKQKLIGKTDISLGQLHLELKHFDLTEPVTEWHPLKDLKTVSLRRTEWAQGAVAQEFREAMYAHALYKHPCFLRSMNDKGKRVYSLSSRSAGSSSKVFVVNGTPVN